MTPLDTKSLRKHLRNHRNNLTEAEQTAHAIQAFNHVKSLIETNPEFCSPQKIAIFLSQDGELDTQATINYLLQKNKHKIFLPVLETRDDWHMAFVQYSQNSTMAANQFGIKEPSAPLNQHLSGEEMDWVFMPLVGFDHQGNRLGMGGGYYDRTFEFKLRQPDSKTKLIGWAHECQRVEALPTEPWDVPLDGILTEKGFTLF